MKQNSVFFIAVMSLVLAPGFMSPALSQTDADHAIVFASDRVQAGAANTVLVQNKRTEATGEKSLPAETRTPGAPVVVGKDTIFFVQERVLSFSPEDRARAVSERIRNIAKNALISLESITAVNGETTSDIVAGDLMIMSVTDRDARMAGRSRQELAEDYAQKIRRALAKQRETYSLRSILVGAGLFLLATAVLVTGIWLLRTVFIKLYIKVASWEGTRIKPLKIQNLEILSAGRSIFILIKLLKGLRLAIILLLFYFYIPLVLDFFPWTHGVASVLYGYMISPMMTVVQSLLAFIPNLLFIAIIVAVIRYVIRGVRVIFSAIANGTISLTGFYRDWAMPTYKIVRFLIIAFGAVVIFPYLPGSKSPAFQGISIFLGILFSLGSTSAVANMVAGIILTYMRPFKMGDRVKIADAEGDVIEKTLLVTRLTTIKNVDITIPNAMVLSSHIINYNSSAKELGLVLHTTVTIGYDAPWRKVHELLIAAAGSVEEIQKEPKPYVLQTALDDFYVHYELNCYTNEPHIMAKTYSQLHQNIQDRFNEAGVEIMSPHYSSLRDGNKATIPEEHLPKTYRAPSFRIGRAGGDMPVEKDRAKGPEERE
jgi:small-conductance mechanosensitive channel